MANNKVQLGDGTVLIDLTEDTVTAASLAAGKTAHDKSGKQITGTGQLFTFNTRTGYILYPETVIVPNTVTATPGSSQAGFYQHSEIKHIIYESGSPITSITPSSFYRCTGLEDIVLPENITHIDTSAFDYCSSLKSIDLPDTLLGLNGGFNYSGLEEITIPDSVTNFNSGPFKNCTSLKSVVLSSGMTRIAASSFSGCTALKSIVFKSVPTSSYYTVTNSNNLFYKCTALEDVVLPQSWSESITLSDGGSNFTNVLTHDSMAAMIANLYDYSDGTAHTLRLGATNLARLSEEEIAVATAKNWTLS